MITRYFTVGQIVKPQGIKGEVKVRSFTDDPKRFHSLCDVMLGDQEGPADRTQVSACRVQGDSVYLRIAGVHDRDGAEKLRGRYIWIERSQAVSLETDTYYLSDLLDCAVVDETGHVYGTIEEVIQTGSNDVYVVRSKDGDELLIPALKSIVSRVDIEARQVAVRAEEVAPYAEI